MGSGSNRAFIGIAAGVAVGVAAAVASGRRTTTTTGTGTSSGGSTSSGTTGSTSSNSGSSASTGSGFGSSVGSTVGGSYTTGSGSSFGSSVGSTVGGSYTTGSVIGTGSTAAPAGPSWSSPAQPAVNASSDLQKQATKLSALLVQANPTAWALSPIARQNFALELALVAKQEEYPLDLLVGHAWAESALTPAMKATAGSGAYGPLQVTRTSCADVGMSYPPATLQDAVRAGIRYMRKCRTYGASSLNDALLMYGLGPGGLQQFKQYGCSGTPCSRPQSVWRHECGCNGASNRYTWKVHAMTRRAASFNLHTLPWADWMAK
ncbi:hypothetical protein V3W47_18900 [Deinococcus sp. YIM 134068]|uniref:hypothetical protein n=1 Tax=Deinococcus lichenicola TaxID=3118910 RepID=UPI002F93175F